MIFRKNSSLFTKTVSHIDLKLFMGNWYVIAGRLTYFEKGAHNAIETYTWNKKENRIDIDFKYNKDSFNGKLKSIPQKGWVKNHQTNAHWKVSPIWPLKLDYLIIDIAPNYSWVVIGVPHQKWVWIMARDWKMNDQSLKKIINGIKSLSYDIKNIHRVPQKW